PAQYPDDRSFPTRRSSDVEGMEKVGETLGDIFRFGGADTSAPAGPGGSPLAAFEWLQDIPYGLPGAAAKEMFERAGEVFAHGGEDRKSTRLNSSHVSISYA